MCNVCDIAAPPTYGGEGVTAWGEGGLAAVWLEYYRVIGSVGECGVRSTGCIPDGSLRSDAVAGFECSPGVGLLPSAPFSDPRVGGCNMGIGFCENPEVLSDVSRHRDGSVGGLCDGERGGRGFSGDAVDCHGDDVVASVGKADVCVKSRSVSAVASKPLPRGPNYLRNKAGRDAKKLRKRERKCDDRLPARSSTAEEVVVSEKQGFWNSCSSDVRQQLIDSKARMHVAENERKAKEAQMKCDEMDSPYAIMQKVVKMAEFAEKQAARANDDRIYGWAKTVASSSAENLAKSTPSSVPSFAELEEKLAASSQSSFDLSLKAKDDEIIELKEKSEKKVNELEMTIAELKLAKGIMDDSSMHFPVLKSRFESKEVVQDVMCEKKKFVPTAKQPWPHVKLTRADVYREF